MSDTYVECLVKAKSSVMAKVLQIVFVVLTVVFVLAMLVFGILALPLAAACGVGAYFMSMQTEVEYEYLYMDRELTIDKIMAKSKRKKVATYSLDRMEIVAPIKSHQLDSFKNRSVKVKDYSVGEELQPDLRYAIYYEGGVKLLISPSKELISAFKNVAPRKVFTD